MLEILILYFLCKTNVKNARARGHNGGAFIALTLVLWFLPEVIAISLIFSIHSRSELYVLLVFGYIFAIIGAVASYLAARYCSDRSFSPTLLRGTLKNTCGLSSPQDTAPYSNPNMEPSINQPFTNPNSSPIPGRPIWETAPVTNYCRSCGQRITPGGKYCPNCGGEI